MSWHAKKNWVGTVAACLALALGLATGGCLWPQAEVGPNPARVVVEIKQWLSPDVLRAAQVPTSTTWSGECCHSLSGPEWVVDAWIKAPDQTLLALPLAPGSSNSLEGWRVEGHAVFLAPPGRQQVHLRLMARITRHWKERVVYHRKVKENGREVKYKEYDWQDRSRSWSLTTMEKDMVLDLPPRGQVTLQDFFSEPAG